MVPIGAHSIPISPPDEGGEPSPAEIAMANVPVLCILLDGAGQVRHLNAAAVERLPAGCDSLAAMLERSETAARIVEHVARGRAFEGDVPLVTVKGVLWHAVSARAAERTDGSEPLIVLSAIDIDARRAGEEEARHLVYHDRLTGLPNRLLLIRELETRLCERDEEERFGVLVVDLDRFKQVNDSLGYDAGDELLREFARRLCLLAGADSLVSRVDSDEFVIVTAGSVDPEELAQQILDAMANPVKVSGNRLHVMPSIGVCLCPEQGKTAADLLGNAHMAMAVAKRRQRGQCVFDAEMNRGARDLLILENDLVRAVRRGQFETHYQPRISLGSNTVAGFEALVRWRHPERGLLMPDEFIEAAERTGTIIDLGNQIMLEAMKQQSAWARAGYDVNISINVSAHQLCGQNLLAAVAQSVTQSSCDPTRIELEITESAFVGDVEEAVATLRRIADLGLRIAMDDFGTGYSNLAYLNRYPLSTLKIDRAFVTDPAQAGVLAAVVDMGLALGLGMVAEGVETSEQVDWLTAHGVTQAQGYLYGRPMTVVDATTYLIEHMPRSGRFRSAA